MTGVPTATILMEATRRKNLDEAIAWLAEDHPMPASTAWPRLLRALVDVIADDTGEVATRALRNVTREVARSEVDTARVVFDADNVRMPSEYAQALTELQSKTEDGSLGSLTPRGVQRAQYANDLAIETLCLAAGVAYNDAREWFASSGGWTIEHIGALLSYLNDLVEGRITSPIASSTPARAIELIEDPDGGWALLDLLHSEGVPYELLLAQRAAGGVWLQHKNKTSSFPNIAAATLLSTRLQQRGIDFRRASTVGGDARQKDLQELSAIPDKRIGVVAVGSTGQATFAVTFSAARDGGTARANGDGLLQIPVNNLPFAIVLTGLGWTRRPETDRLARRYAGRLFTERSIDDLVDCIAQATS